jgi:ABC-type antimicrobial peptide transport system permease subunit
MSVRYLKKSFWRNKKRSLLLMVGIIISITLVSGNSIAFNQFSSAIISEKIDDVKVDFNIYFYGDQVSEAWQQLEDFSENLDEPNIPFLSTSARFGTSILKKGGETINTTLSFNLTDFEVNAAENKMWFCGLNQDVFHQDLDNRFDGVLQYNESFNFSNEGVYLDADTAERYDIAQGDLLSFAYLTHITKDDVTYNYTAQINNISVLGVVDIIDKPIFNEVFLRYSGTHNENMIFLGSVSYISELIENIRLQIDEKSREDILREYSISAPIWGGLLIDHNAYVKGSPTFMMFKLSQINSQFWEPEYGQLNTHGGGPLYRMFRGLQESFLVYQGILLLIILPTIILSWFLVKIVFTSSFSQRTREFALLRARYGTQKKMKRMTFLELVLIGVFGGLLGIIGGNCASLIILNHISPTIIARYSFSDFLVHIFLWNNISITTLAISVGFGLVLSLSAGMKVVKEALKTTINQGLEQYSPTTANKISRKKIDKILLLIGIFPIICTFILGFFPTEMYYTFDTVFSLLGPISGVLLPLSPFIITYSTIRIFCGESKWLTKIVSTISQKFFKKTARINTISITRNQKRSFQIIFIIGLSLSFITMGSILGHSNDVYQEQYEELTTGGGVRFAFSSPNLSYQGVSPYLSLFWQNQSTFNFESFNYAVELYDSGIVEEKNFDVVKITTQNFSDQINIQDEWFENISAEEAMKALVNTPNGTLIPRYYEKYYQIDDLIPIEYMTVNDTRAEAYLRVVGYYHLFPLMEDDDSPPKALMVDYTSLPNAKSGKVNFIFYPPSNSDLQPIKVEDFEELLADFDPEGNFNSFQTIENNLNVLVNTALSYYNFEAYFLLVLTVFGITVIIDISMQEKSNFICIFRSHGVKKREISRIQLNEILILLIIGSFFIINGVLGAATLLPHINSFVEEMNSLQRTFSIPWLETGLMIFIFALSITITSYVSIKLEMRKSDIGRINNLFKTL